MLIGLTGLAGSGKSEVARILAEFGFAKVKFADPLKNMARSLIRDIGHSPATVERYVDGDLKEEVIPGLGITSRWLQQSIGTEWGRDTIRPTFWTDIWKTRADGCGSMRVMSDDVRFPNEIQTVRTRSGVIWKVERPGVVAGNHPSERYIADLEADLIIENNGSLLDLRIKVVDAAQAIIQCA
jgi:hypothetical protein